MKLVQLRVADASSWRVRSVRTVMAAVVVVLAVLVLGACQVDSSTTVTLLPDGGAQLSLVVTVDRDVAERLDRSSDEPKLDGLTQAGWTVMESTSADGSIEYVASATCVDASACVAQLDALGVFRDLSITVTPDRVTDQIKLSAALDLSAGVATFGLDPAVVTDEAMIRTYGVSPAQATRFSLTLVAPEGYKVNAPGAVLTDGSALWQAALGSSTPIEFVATEDSASTVTKLWVAVGAMFLGTCLLIVAVGLWIARRRKLRHLRSHAIEIDDSDSDDDGIEAQDSAGHDHDPKSDDQPQHQLDAETDDETDAETDDETDADPFVGDDDEPPYRAPKHAR